MDTIQQLKDKITPILKEVEAIKFAYLHGSYADGSNRENSDLDLAIFVEKDVFEVRNKTLDLLDKAGFENIDLGILSYDSESLFNFQVISKGILLFTKNLEFQNRVEAEMLARYYDAQHFRDLTYQLTLDRLNYNG